MGQTTPNMSIYIPSAGETNYEQSFASGMMNIDQHDHSGGPNKGVPINSSGLADFSVTFDKLNANVVDPTTGIGTRGGAFQNQLQLLGYLANLYQRSIAPSPVGFVVMNGGVSEVRTFQNTATLTWNNADGTGNPSADVNIAGLTPVVVANGGTGKTSFNPWDIICGGSTGTGALQQVLGEGTIGQVLTSAGAGALPVWSTYANAGIVNFSSVTLNQSDMQNLNSTPIELVPAPGSGKIINPLNVYAILNFGSTPFTGAVSIAATYAPSFSSSGILFPTSAFLASADTYYTAVNNGLLSSGVSKTNAQNRALSLLASGPFGGGNGCTVTFICSYLILTL